MLILLAKDVGLVRLDLAQELESHNHTVIQAQDGGYACRELIEAEEAGVTIDSVITDRNMPNADGLYLLQFIAGCRHQPPTLLHSDSDFVTIEGESVHLREVVKYFPFAQFHSKNGRFEYIHAFLNDVTAR